MNTLRIAAIAGFAAAGLAIGSVLLWQSRFMADSYVFSVVFSTIGALLNVLYWYGFALVGKRLRSTALYALALLGLFFSILIDASNAAFTLLSYTAASSLWDVFGYSMTAANAMASIATGIVVYTLRARLGDPAVLYGVFAILLGIVFFADDGTAWFMFVFGIALTAITYSLGAMILLRASKA